RLLDGWKYFLALHFVFLIHSSGIAESNHQKPGLKLYVSTEGNDNWSGKLSKPNCKNTNGPFATIEKARDVIRALKEENNLPKGSIIVEIQGGTYEFSRPFELEAKDSGQDSLSRIIYQGAKGKEVRLSGGKNIVKWEPVTEQSVLSKL